MAAQENSFSLEGSWVMQSAYEILADGSRVTTYTEHPDGLLMVDQEGRYSLQIFRPARKKFSDGKANATLEELKDAALGSSTHFGLVVVDAANMQLIFKIEAASFPNWNNTQQVRDYKLIDGLLTYQVPASASANGTIAYSIWKRVSR